MPWEQGEGDTASSPTPAGANPTTTSSGGSSKNVPPPAQGTADGLGQGSGSTTVSAADGMTPPASQAITGQQPAEVGQSPAPGSAGALARQAQPTVVSPPEPESLEAAHPEGAEGPKHAMRSKEAALAGDRQAPVIQVEREAAGSQVPPEAISPPDATQSPQRTPAAPAAAQGPAIAAPAGRTTAGAGQAPLAKVGTPGMAGMQDDQALVEAVTQHLAAMLARALHESVAAAVREVRAREARPAAPANVRDQAKPDQA